MRITFSDPDLQREFQAKGYVVVDCLGESAVGELNKLFRRVYGSDGAGFDVSIVADPSDRKVIRDEFTRLFEPSVSTMFDRHRQFITNYVVKWPGQDSEVGPHQDWSFVDETRFVSLNVWCPLVDTDDTNGSLCLVPGSHRIPGTVRGSPHPFNTRLTPFEKRAAEEYGVMLPLRAGQAIAYAHQLIHFSPPNASNLPRIAAAVGVAPDEAELFHFFRTSTGSIERYEIDPDFYLWFNIGEKPDGRLAETTSGDFADLTWDQVVQSLI